jgi:hypothetical protein
VAALCHGLWLRLQELAGRARENHGLDLYLPTERMHGVTVEHGSRRVDYVLPVPADPDRWVVVSFSTLGSGDPNGELARLLVELFDAMMTTFRWRRP